MSEDVPDFEEELATAKKAKEDFMEGLAGEANRLNLDLDLGTYDPEVDGPPILPPEEEESTDDSSATDGSDTTAANNGGDPNATAANNGGDTNGSTDGSDTNAANTGGSTTDWA